MMKNRELNLILLAAGSSTRLGTGKKKEYLKLGSGTVLSASLGAFLRYEKIYSRNFSSIIITVPAGGEDDARSALEKDEKTRSSMNRLTFINGGKTRQESVLNALEKLGSAENQQEEENRIVLIHDSA
ncbi:MAG: 2-C-methyl-D-erythritol 4-phosphate cytidylyltransferase, partial [Treponema sp.]|nr:2-C-methyl-D-erythritol 4-phosphate cytidylyltransferase [Treponema sp.]